MATYRKYKGRWTATVRIPDGYPKPVAKKSISETFTHKEKAKDWARRAADAMKLGLWEDPRLKEAEPVKPQTMTLRKALDRLLRDIIPTRKGQEQDESLAKRWQAHPLADRPLDEITAADIADFRDERIRAGMAASTIRNEINMISGLYEIATHDWAIEVENPVAKLKKRKKAMPSLPPGRSRRMKPDEENAMLEALAGGPHGAEAVACTIIATETGMRQGEILGILRTWFDGPDIIEIPDTKNNTSRRVVLSERAVQAVAKLPARISGKLFSLAQTDLDNAWRRARKMVGCKDLRFHDLRHEALSRMAAGGANIKVMMRQSGHKTPAMLMRYLNPTDEDVRDALAKMTRK